MIDAKELNAESLGSFQPEISFTNLNDQTVRIDFPFLENRNDEINLYAIEQNNGSIKLTDDGWTLDNLESHGVALSNTQFQSLGVSHGDGELSIMVNREQILPGTLRLLQAIMNLNAPFSHS